MPTCVGDSSAITRHEREPAWMTSPTANRLVWSQTSSSESGGRRTSSTRATERLAAGTSRSSAITPPSSSGKLLAVQVAATRYLADPSENLRSVEVTCVHRSSGVRTLAQPSEHRPLTRDCSNVNAQDPVRARLEVRERARPVGAASLRLLSNDRPQQQEARDAFIGR